MLGQGWDISVNPVEYLWAMECLKGRPPRDYSLSLRLVFGVAESPPGLGSKWFFHRKR